MTICTRRGCGFDFDASSKASTCHYHPGRPVFRDQAKSWSCCEAIHKPVLDFEDFVAIKGCAQAEEHTAEKQALPDDPRQTGGDSVANGSAEASSSGSQPVGAHDSVASLPSALYGVTLAAARQAEAARRGGAKGSAPSSSGLDKTVEEDEDEDPEDVTIPDGAPCKRTGCKATYREGQARERETETCIYHPKPAIFHEGSKGYACCKRRVLEFSEFLTIEPCTTARKGHLFVGRPKAGAAEDEEIVECRMDHFETPAAIMLTVYAKGADMEKSQITMTEDEVDFSLSLPPAPSNGSRSRRFKRTLKLFSKIDPAASSYTSTKFKIDLILVKKAAGESWPSLERSDRVFGVRLTFGRALDAQSNAARP